MCHSYADLRYLKRDAEGRAKEIVRDTTPAPASATEPGGLVAALRRLIGKVRSAKTTVPAE